MSDENPYLPPASALSSSEPDRAFPGLPDHRSYPGIGVLAGLQLLFGSVTVLALISMVSSSVLSQLTESGRPYLAYAIPVASLLLASLLLVSGVGLFKRSRYLGLYPAQASAVAMFALQVAAFVFDLRFRPQFVIYSVVLLLLLSTRYRYAFPKQSP